MKRGIFKIELLSAFSPEYVTITDHYPLTLCILMDSSFWFDIFNLIKSIVHI